MATDFRGCGFGGAEKITLIRIGLIFTRGGVEILSPPLQAIDS